MRPTARAYLLSTVSCIALAGAAAAADIRMPVKAPVEAPPTWAGSYIGVNAGVAWHRWRFNDVDDQLLAVPAGINANNIIFSGTQAAFTAGGQVGYNLQYDRVVFGIEGDLNWVGANNSITFPIPVGANNTGTASTRLDWLATIRGRLGVALSPTLVYVTGGVAFAHVNDSFFGTFPAFAAAGPTAINKTLAGFAVGAGIEHMFAKHWSVKLEGLFVGLEKATTTARMSGQSYRSEFKHSLALIRLGINRKLPVN